MPLKSTAAGVSEAFHAPTMKRVEQKVVDKLEQLEIVSTFVRAALDAAVSAYFDDRDTRGLPPYERENRGYAANIDVLTSATLASGNAPDLETALRTLDGRLKEEVKKRVQQDCVDAGYQAWVVFDPAAMTLRVQLSDSQFQPINEALTVQSRVRDALGTV